MSFSTIRKLNQNPSLILLVTQLFSTISYAVLYSTLVLFMTQKLKFSPVAANALMGLYVAFNYGLHLLGGYIGGRLLSYRFLFILGMILQVIAVLILALETTTALYIGLALFLTASGLNVPCINMMLTQQFEPESLHRETSFIWNYAGMNLGFLIGFTVAGFFQLKHAFATLFALTAITNLIAALIVFWGWKVVKDHTTPLAKAIKKGTATILKRGIWGVLVVLGVFVALIYLLEHAHTTNIFVLCVGAAMYVLFLYLGFTEKNALNRKRIYAYVILGLAGMVFFSLYQLMPMGLTLFALNNVDRTLWGFTIPPQWIQNINTIIIMMGGLVLPFIFRKIRKRYLFSYPIQFAFSLTFISIGFLILAIGIYLANPQGLSNFSWIGFSYVFQSLGELFIGPIGYAMIGSLATENLQGLMMGSWMLITGGSSGVIASYLSNYAIYKSTTSNPLVTNAGYAKMFLIIGIVAAVTAFILFCLVPFLRKLIGITKTEL